MLGKHGKNTVEKHWSAPVNPFNPFHPQRVWIQAPVGKDLRMPLRNRTPPLEIDIHAQFQIKKNDHPGRTHCSCRKLSWEVAMTSLHRAMQGKNTKQNKTNLQRAKQCHDVGVQTNDPHQQLFGPAN